MAKETKTKEFDFIKVLEDTCKKLDEDIVVSNAKKEMLVELINFMNANKLVVTKPEINNVEVSEETK